MNSGGLESAMIEIAIVQYLSHTAMRPYLLVCVCLSHTPRVVNYAR